MLNWSGTTFLVFFIIFQIQGQSPSTPCCESPKGGIVWSSTSPNITVDELVSACAPILWFSPDEPLLYDKHWDQIAIPEPFPFDTTISGPVVYYRLREILGEVDSTHLLEKHPPKEGNSILKLNLILGIKLDFFFYYSSEEGLGSHLHDIEGAEFRLEVNHNTECDECPYTIRVRRIVALAHGLEWYDNILEVDKYTIFPMTILVEEGKHASCTDKNGDGYFTPGFDVNRQKNDAWAVRDVIRSGILFTGKYEAWMTKVRPDGYYVLPPLPKNSPHYQRFINDDRQRDKAAVYKIRPLPDYKLAQDEKLRDLMKSKKYHNWPIINEANTAKVVGDFLKEENFLNSLGFNYRYDGQHGFSVVFPLLIVKSVHEPLSGGWLVQRLYFKGPHLRDIGHNILYTPSGSRWIDPYFAIGYEVDRSTAEIIGSSAKWDLTLETGIKLRVNFEHTPLKFLRRLGTKFWGLRTGIQYVGFSEIEKLRFAIELGAGRW